MGKSPFVISSETVTIHALSALMHLSPHAVGVASLNMHAMTLRGSVTGQCLAQQLEVDFRLHNQESINKIINSAKPLLTWAATSGDGKW